MSSTIYLDGEYRFNQPRNIMAPSITVVSGQNVPFRMETGACGSNVILMYKDGPTAYECRLCFDSQKEADEWIDDRRSPPPCPILPSETIIHPNR